MLLFRGGGSGSIVGASTPSTSGSARNASSPSSSTSSFVVDNEQDDNERLRRLSSASTAPPAGPSLSASSSSSSLFLSWDLSPNGQQEGRRGSSRMSPVVTSISSMGSPTRRSFKGKQAVADEVTSSHDGGGFSVRLPPRSTRDVLLQLKSICGAEDVLVVVSKLHQGYRQQQERWNDVFSDSSHPYAPPFSADGLTRIYWTSSLRLAQNDKDDAQTTTPPGRQGIEDVFPSSIPRESFLALLRTKYAPDGTKKVHRNLRQLLQKEEDNTDIDDDYRQEINAIYHSLLKCTSKRGEPEYALLSEEDRVYFATKKVARRAAALRYLQSNLLLQTEDHAQQRLQATVLFSSWKDAVVAATTEGEISEAAQTSRSFPTDEGPPPPPPPQTDAEEGYGGFAETSDDSILPTDWKLEIVRENEDDDDALLEDLSVGTYEEEDLPPTATKTVTLGDVESNFPSPTADLGGAAADPPTPRQRGAARKAYPTWVERLLEEGLSAKKVQIHFCVRVPPAPPSSSEGEMYVHLGGVLSQAEASRLTCIMTVEQESSSEATRIVGEAYFYKEEALESAALLVQEVMAMQRALLAPPDLDGPPTIGNKSKKRNDPANLRLTDSERLPLEDTTTAGTDKAGGTNAAVSPNTGQELSSKSSSDDSLGLKSLSKGRKQIISDHHSTNDNGNRDKKAKELLASVPKSVTYPYPVPSIFTTPFASGKSGQVVTAYLYELFLEMRDGQPIVLSSFKGYTPPLSRDTCTRVGIVFPYDIWDPRDDDGNSSEAHKIDSLISTTFALRQQAAKVRLGRRTVVSMSTPMLTYAQLFNNTLRQWKTYGIYESRYNESEADRDELLALHQQQNDEASTNASKAKGEARRTYMFVPLCRSEEDNTMSNSKQDDRLSIDWTMIQQTVCHEYRPYVKPPADEMWHFPVVGHVDSVGISVVFASIGIIVVAPFLYTAAKRFASEYVVMRIQSCPCLELSSVEMTIVGFFCTLSLLTLLWRFFLSPPRVESHSDLLWNRFLIQKKAARKSLYVMDPPPRQERRGSTAPTRLLLATKTARSRLHEEDAKRKLGSSGSNRQKSRKGATSSHHRNQHFPERDRSKETFADYYWFRYGILLRYPKLPLLPVRVLKHHADHDFLRTPAYQASSQSLQEDGEDDYAESSLSAAVVANDSRKGGPIYLMPELVQVLPLPRDFVYVYRLASLFATELERAIAFHNFSRKLQAMGRRTTFGTSFRGLKLQDHHRMFPLGYETPSQRWKRMIGKRTFPSLLREASTLDPCVTYDRLESVGDTVLKFFLAINLMARNFRLRLDSMDLGGLRQSAERNAELFHAALRTGVYRALWRGTKPWKTAYNFQKQGGTYRENTDGMESSSSLPENVEGTETTGTVVSSDTQTQQHCFLADIGDSRMSDVMESLLAAAFLADLPEAQSVRSNGRIIVAILEEMQLPLPKENEVSTSTGAESRRHSPVSDGPWFRALGPCLDEGYPFELDRVWKKELVDIGTTLFCSHEVVDKLERGRRHLMENVFMPWLHLPKLKMLNSVLESQKGHILLYCALFDDSLDDGISRRSSISKASSEGRPGWKAAKVNSDDDNDNDEDTIVGLELVAMFRETLAFVGQSALYLCTTTELFCRFPDATAGDLHLQKSVAMCDDVLSYILVKNGIHQALYDKNSASLAHFVAEMTLADERGREVWDKREGWILPGGVKEFRKRCHIVANQNPDGSEAVDNQHINNGNSHPGATSQEFFPRYEGLAGGRLRGHVGKLPLGMTEELSFSMKALIGALLLSVGLEGMWYLVGPLLEENFLLSANELREEYGDVSSICRNYEKGHESSKAKAFREGSY